MPPFISGSDGVVVAGDTLFSKQDLEISVQSHSGNVTQGQTRLNIFDDLESAQKHSVTFSREWTEAASVHREGWASDGVRQDLVKGNFSRPQDISFDEEPVESMCNVVTAYGALTLQLQLIWTMLSTTFVLNARFAFTE